MSSSPALHPSGVLVGSGLGQVQYFCKELHEMLRSTGKHHVHNQHLQGMGSIPNLGLLGIEKNVQICTENSPHNGKGEVVVNVENKIFFAWN